MSSCSQRLHVATFAFASKEHTLLINNIRTNPRGNSVCRQQMGESILWFAVGLKDSLGLETKKTTVGALRNCESQNQKKKKKKKKKKRNDNNKNRESDHPFFASLFFGLQPTLQ